MICEMQGWIAGLALVVIGACSAGDDVAGGARAQCAHGGELTDCPDAERTAQGACWRLVDCGAIAVSSGDPQSGRFDWDRCVGSLESLASEYQRLVINCVAASSCDQLRVDGSPDQPNTNQILCLALGGR